MDRNAARNMARKDEQIADVPRELDALKDKRDAEIARNLLPTLSPADNSDDYSLRTTERPLPVRRVSDLGTFVLVDSPAGTQDSALLPSFASAFCDRRLAFLCARCDLCKYIRGFRHAWMSFCLADREE